jgi:hypothetical protein
MRTSSAMSWRSVSRPPDAAVEADMTETMVDASLVVVGMPVGAVPVGAARRRRFAAADADSACGGGGDDDAVDDDDGDDAEAGGTGLVGSCSARVDACVGRSGTGCKGRASASSSESSSSDTSKVRRILTISSKSRFGPRMGECKSASSSRERLPWAATGGDSGDGGGGGSSCDEVVVAVDEAGDCGDAGKAAGGAALRFGVAGSPLAPSTTAAIRQQTLEHDYGGKPAICFRGRISSRM